MNARMAVPGSTPRRRRPRPLAGAPVGALVERAPEIARGWLLAVLEVSPLDALAALPAAEFARRAPELCAAVARALGDESALDRLRPGGELAGLAAQSGRLAGASDPAGCLGAVEVLREVTWATAWAALEAPEPEEVAELAVRLSHVCGVVAAAAVRAPLTAALDVAPRAPRWQGPEPTGTGGASPWVPALEERIASGRPFALLLAELEDLDRLTGAEPELHLEALFARLARAVRAEVRGPDVVAWEDGGRTWVIADDVARGGAESLARRIAEALRGAEWRGAPLLASIGFALYPQDAERVEALIEAAEEGVFAARSAGWGVGAPGGPSR